MVSRSAMSPWMMSAFDDWFEECCEQSDELDMERFKVDLKMAFCAGVRASAEWTAIYLKEEV